jgi:hypothetical protein
MRALTLKAPWGTAIATLGKDVENRTWKPPASIIGQRIAIHQGVGVAREGLRMLEKKYGALEYEAGVIVCTAVVLGWVDDDGNHSDSLTAREAKRARRSKWYQGSVGWVLGSVRRPRVRVKAKGMLGVWSLPNRTAKRLLQGSRS